MEDDTSEFAALLDACRARGLRLATAESCTGGLIAAGLTAIAGSSDVVECGFVTYSNTAKTALLGVPAPMIAAHGAVSEAVARAMAVGALARSEADLAVSVTGIAGPGGGSESKPVGLVWLGLARGGRLAPHAEARRCLFGGDRAAVRAASVVAAVAMLRAAIAG